MSYAIGTDAGVAVDIAQVSTSDSCSKCEKELNQGHVRHQVISFICTCCSCYSRTSRVGVKLIVELLLEYSRSAALVIHNTY